MNKTFIIGVVITVIFFILAILGPTLAPYPVHYQLKPYTIQTNVGAVWVVPPTAPSVHHWFGTDKWGYDILTLMIYGLRWTFFAALFIAFSRVIIGGLTGIFVEYVRKKESQGANTTGLNALPMFIIVFFAVFGISLNPQVSSITLAALVSIMFVILGLPGIISTVSGKAREIKNRQFVLAAHSLGASPVRIMLRHLLPHLKESFLILIVNEIILALTMFGQLGIFHIFIGGDIVQRDPLDPTIYLSMTHEWAGMIGNARVDFSGPQWILLYPLLGYVLLIIGFYFISRGLEKHYRQKYHKSSHI